MEVWVLSRGIHEIAYDEGYEAYVDKFYAMDNPYDGVHQLLSDMWSEGWWDAFYEELK